MRGRQAGVEIISRQEAATVGTNIRALRQSKGWTQAHVGDLMGWVSNSTVCAAEGHRDGRQRGFTSDEVQRLARIFGVKAWQLTTRCTNCGGHPPPGFSCLTCRAQTARTSGDACASRPSA